ncbi:DNA double-strand break repair nuclease NurA [Phorcysia thermohydrogeniphila]|uniref:DNA double-strand break repair nuclease NurA n=1 Tax=Phorcysia thermohydrogeniphila TaxID=936138 RepID=UPI001402BF94|nr:DNA double-strand break repair nuclease NurA [Phorcysia thermohydrogeniphila]
MGGDEARERALEELLSSVISAYEEDVHLDKKIEGYISLVPLLKKVFEESVEVKVGENSYTLSLESVDKEELLRLFEEKVKGKWLLAVDESQQSGDLILNQSYFFRGSLAYGLKVTNKEDEDREKILAVLSSFKVAEETYPLKDKLDLQTYIQNLLVTLYSLIVLIAKGEDVYGVFIDGPLIRDIHHFLFITFNREELLELFKLDPKLKEELGNEGWISKGFYSEFLGKNITVEVLAGGKLLDYILSSPAYEEVLELLSGRGHEEEKLRLTFSYYGGWEEVKKRKVIPGIVIYFFLLRLLSDLAREEGILVHGIVKASHRSKEFLRFYYSKAFTKLAERNLRFRYKLYGTGLFPVDEDKMLRFSERLKRGEISRVLLEEMSLTDDHLIAFCLDFKADRANFTLPVEIRRHRSKRANREEVFEIEKEFRVATAPYGSATTEEQTFWLERVLLDTILPQDTYKFYMLYLRTSELKFPLRVEFSAANLERAKEIASVVYLLSSVYRNYGIPVILKYADFLVRVSTRMIQRLSRGLLKDKLLKELMEVAESLEPGSQEIMKMLMYEFKRDFYTR